MESVFLHLLNMSITAGWLVLAVVVLRLVFRRAPKWIHCLLWVLVALRLLFPVSIESIFSLIPSAETVPVDTFLYETPSIHSGVPLVDAVVNPVISNSFAPNEMNSVNPMQVVSILAANVWVLGMVGMVLYAAISTIRLRHRVREAAYLRDNVWQCDRISTPFILGIVRPRIYLPTLLGAAEAQSVVAHERAHLARRDHWWKPLGFLLLTVYWFHPLLWVGYVLLCRDIEAACDQRVVRDMDVEGRREYSRVLLACSAPRHVVTACPLAFGETGVKSRIRSVLNYKKPAFWLVLTAIIATAVAAVCLLTNPKQTVSDDLDAFLSQAILEYNAGAHTGDAYPTESHTVFGVSRGYGHTTVYGMVLYEEYGIDENGTLTVQSGSHGPTILTVDKNANGAYYLVDYWTPRDGEDYARDIRDKFPARHRGKALDTDGYYDSHHHANWAKAQLHYSDIEVHLSRIILSQNTVEDAPGIFGAEAHEVLDIETVDGRTTAYLIVYYQEYAMVSGTEATTTSSYATQGNIVERSVVITAAAITMQKSGNVYELVEYWTPGKNYAEDIQSKFPSKVAAIAADYANYPIDTFKTECRAKARLHFGLSTSNFTTGPVFPAMGRMPEDKLKTLYTDLSSVGLSRNLPVVTITSRVELDAFIDEYDKEMGFHTVEGDGLTPAHQMSFYDGDFFAENILLAVYYTDGSCSVQPRIVGVEKPRSADHLQVQVDVYQPQSGDSALGQWFLLCEVKRSLIRDVQYYTAVVRDDVAIDHYAAEFTDAVTIDNIANASDLWRNPLSDQQDTYLRQMLSAHQWSSVKPDDREWYIIGCFNLDGTTYYITSEFEALYRDGERVVLNSDERVYLRALFRYQGLAVISTTATNANTYISEQQALSIAAAYWGITLGERDPETGYEMTVSVQQTPTAEAPHYCIVRQVMVPSAAGAAIDKRSSLYVDAVTGEVILPEVWTPDQS